MAVILQGNEFIAIFHAACLIMFDVSLRDKLLRSYSAPDKFTERLLKSLFKKYNTAKEHFEKFILVGITPGKLLCIVWVSTKL